MGADWVETRRKAAPLLGFLSPARGFSSAGVSQALKTHANDGVWGVFVTISAHYPCVRGCVVQSPRGTRGFSSEDFLPDRSHFAIRNTHAHTGDYP